MKRTIAMMLTVLMMAASSAGCGKSSAEKATEDLVKDLTGMNVDLSGDSGMSSLKDDAGNGIQVGLDLEWPKDHMGDLPKLEGSIISVLTAETGSSLTVQDVSREDVDAYMQELKDLGYTDELSENEMTGNSFTFSARKDDGVVQLIYTPEKDDKASTCMLIYGIDKK